MAEAIETLLKTKTLKAGYAIRLGLQETVKGNEIVRASVYSGSSHQLTIALNDRRQYVPAPEPVDPGIMAERDSDNAGSGDRQPRPAERLQRDLSGRAVIRPAGKHGGAGRAHGGGRCRLPVDDQAVRPPGAVLLAARGRRRRPRGARACFSSRRPSAAPRGPITASALPTASVDYYDEEGRSARQFLLRKPVPNGRFRSPFGMRRHPILGYSRMHWGVDWAAPRGTPIIAPGNGTVAKAGWSSGYGKQTVIRHANGYETSYSHQTEIRQGHQAGRKVRQGQVIGYVGSTGLSTGPHLHYEMKVNGTRVDPMRVRLPDGKVLEGQDLEAFKRERDRINALLDKGGDATVVARADG
jgi:murein DD-endopeptidase MepM/ murein hydrolase activator NlpD